MTESGGTPTMPTRSVRAIVMGSGSLFMEKEEACTTKEDMDEHCSQKG